MNDGATRIPSLDGLRAISIILVIISHAVFTRNAMIPLDIAYRWVDNLGLLGVRIFFVISGFLITNILLQELDAKKTILLTRFYFRRTMRIFVPFYFFILVVILLHTLGWVTLAPDDLLHAFTYTVNYYPDRSWTVGHGWSLSVEEQFYLLWPALLLVLGKRRALWGAFLFVLIAPLIRLGYYYFFPSLAKYEIGYRFETSADAIAVGCLLAGLHQWLSSQPLYQKALNSKLMILIPFIVLYAAELDQHSKRYLLVGIPMQNVGIAACIAWAVTKYRGRVGRVLNSQLIVFLGLMSYSIYLWQQMFLNPRSNSIFTDIPLNLILVAPTALASYFLVERPALRLRHWLEPKIFSRGDTAKQDGRVVAG